MDKLRATEIFAAARGKRIVVVGDIMLDEYIWGQVNRISPEAPVMVVDAERYSQVPGGAANVLNNLCCLGATGAIVGTIGDDNAARQLRALLGGEGADVTGLVAAGDRPTTRKTRIIAHSQQVVRVDHESRRPLPEETVRDLVEQIERLTQQAHAIILSDYLKGVVSRQVIAACVDLAARRRIPLTGNLKPRTIGPASALTVLTLNLLEASQATGGETLDTEAKISEAGRRLLEKSGSEHVLITRGAQGLNLFSASAPGQRQHVPARPVEVYDVAGAGDTVISTMTLALAAGAGPLEAVTLANCAAAQAVKKVGVATVTPDEVMSGL